MTYGLEISEKMRNETSELHDLGKEKHDCQWRREKEVTFQAIKQSISINAIALPDPEGQYHLAVDASKKGVGVVLFQLNGIPPGTDAGSSAFHHTAQRILIFISFRLTEVETRYSNSEREALVVIDCLAEV